jgi:hypothetical protein
MGPMAASVVILFLIGWGLMKTAANDSAQPGETD